MQLRYYQEEAIHALRNALNDGAMRPVVCMPTGSGKAATICTFIKGLVDRFDDERFVVAVHTKELVAQLAATYERIAGVRPAVFSASLRRKEIDNVMFCQIQSIAKQACKIGRIKLMCIDEADRCPVDGTGQYRTFIKEALVVNPDLRVCGFTATPYRTSTGLVYGEGMPFDSLVYDIGIKRLIHEGYLSKLATKDGGKPDLSNVHIRQGEYVANELEDIMADDLIVDKSVEEILRYGESRRSGIIFSSGSKHALMIQESFKKHGVDVPIVESTMDVKLRDEYVKAHREYRIKYIININILSVGYDNPGVDLLALMRPTLSPGLYYQQVGRGLRIAEGKVDCLVLDFAGNTSTHGPIDTLNERIKVKIKGGKGEAPTKTCEACKEIVPAGCRKCPACGEPFPELQVAKHEASARIDSPISDSEIKELAVVRWTVRLHQSRDKSKGSTIQVTYWNGVNSISEWLSVAKTSHHFARQKALQWIHENPRNGSREMEIMVRNGRIIGYTSGGEVQIDSAEECMPYAAACFVKPVCIRYQTDPNNGKYPRVLSRIYQSTQTA